MRRLLAILLLMLMFGSLSTIPAQAKTFKNCADLQKVYKYGISLSVKTANRGAGPIFTPRVSASVFKLNTKLDLDKDKIACEVVKPKPSSTSATSTSPVPDLTSTPNPYITGAFRIGNVLTANPDEWDSGVSLSYQWLRNGSAIAGATSRTYTVVAADLWTKISVQATGSKPGFNSAVRLSYAHGIIIWGPNPGIYGTPSLGSTLDAFPGVFDSETSKRYQWLRNGSPIDGALFSNYTLVALDAGTSITLQVTVFKVNDLSTEVRTSNAIYVPGHTAPATTPTQTPSPTTNPIPSPTTNPTPSPTTPDLDSIPTPEPTGIARVGSTLDANPGTWTSGVSLSYQWLRNGSAIAGATSRTYTLVTADGGKSITVQVTGSKSGFNSAVRISSPVSVPAPTATPTPSPTTNPTPSPTTPNLDSTPTPEPTGIARVGSTLDANPGTWTSGVSLSYQWLRNGSAIAGATSRTYTLVTADGGTSITVQVTGSKSGFNSATRTSAALAISFPASSSPTPTPNLTLTPTPTIGGDGRVGNTLTAETWTWDSGVTLSYQWLRNGSAISGATSRTYRLVNEDGGTQISVRVTGSKVGYSSATKTSSGNFIYDTCPLLPTISGEGIVGQTLNLIVVPSKEYCAVGSYFRKWLRNGAEIDGATGPTYTLTPLDAGQNITVSILDISGGLSIVSTWRFSAPVTVYTPFSSIIRDPSITQAWSTLTAQTGNWGAGVVLSYQWLRNGSLIPGATEPTYTLDFSDRNTQISVRVTGSAPGYKSVVRTSKPITG